MVYDNIPTNRLFFRLSERFPSFDCRHHAHVGFGIVVHDKLVIAVAVIVTVVESDDAGIVIIFAVFFVIEFCGYRFGDPSVSGLDAVLLAVFFIALFGTVWRKLILLLRVFVAGLHNCFQITLDLIRLFNGVGVKIREFRLVISIAVVFLCLTHFASIFFGTFEDFCRIRDFLFNFIATFHFLDGLQFSLELQPHGLGFPL
mmetsp:Transcript_9093/g.19421  ORF Transcript_9093/g.19421 Transcript_9093/m.19421 type:complete len:201 (+) Transcript_9093:791-1393(+)